MGGTGLTEHLRYAYGPLEGRMGHYTVYSTVQVENGRKLRWNLVDSRDLPYSARVVKLTNHDFLSPG